MPLPNPGIVIVPFTQGSAEVMNNVIENVEALADGTGLDDGAVTAEKMLYGTVKRRQGGSATDYNAAGTTNYDASAANIKVQIGTTVPAGLTTSVTFPEAFTNVPHITATPYGSAGNFSQFYLVTESTTGFSFVASTYTNVSKFQWIAIGT